MPSLSGVTGGRDQSLGSSQSSLNGQQIFANCFSEFVKLSDEKSDSDHCKEKLIQKNMKLFTPKTSQILPDISLAH